MDEIRKKVLQAIEDRGDLTQAGASAFIGKKPTYLNQYIVKGSPKVLTYEQAVKLAQYCGKPREYFMTDEQQRTTHAPTPSETAPSPADETLLLRARFAVVLRLLEIGERWSEKEIDDKAIEFYKLALNFRYLEKEKLEAALKDMARMAINKKTG